MRIISFLLLMSSACTLAACAGGGGGELSAAGVLANKSDVCKLFESCEQQPTGGGTTPPSTTPTVPPGSATGGNTGLPTNSPGNKTIALQKFVLDSPTPGKVATAQITSSVTGNYAATEAAILAKAPPASLKFTVDTATTNNTLWAVPEEMPYYDIGTRELTWIKFNHTTVDFSNPANYDVKDADGNQLIYDRSKNAFVYAASAITSQGPVAAGDKADHRVDAIWSQIVPYMGSKANGGTKDAYREYRNVKSDPLNTRKELIQLWTWNDSYTTNYENQSGGGSPKQQAWSFGGNESTSVRTTGTANYVGRFVANALAEGFIPRDGAAIKQNGNWTLQGRSDTAIDFDKSNLEMETTLSPETWTSLQKTDSGAEIRYTWTNGVATVHDSNNVAGVPSTDSIPAPNYDELYGIKIKLKGSLVPAAATSTTPGVKNSLVGTAALNGDYTSSDQIMHAGLYGTNGDEITGIFSVKGSLDDPSGGTHPITDPRGASVTISGAFNGCVSDPVKCPP
jgi:hypothetical protein